MNNKKEVFHHINLPKKILTHVVGHDHPMWLRMILGGLIVISASYMPDGIRFFRAIGEILVAVGAVPFVEAMIAFAESCTNCK